MPDLTQTAQDLALPGGGGSYCGPVAVSNAIAGWAAAGQHSLLPDAHDPRAAQTTLVKLLGSARYMGTGVNSGTGAAGLMVGLERYLRDRGFAATLQYDGWRAHPQRFSSGRRTPSAEAIRTAFDAGSAVFVNIGWYQPSPRVAGVYRRHGGHWLTLVGHGVDAAGEPAVDVLILHDPAPWAGAEGARHFARFAPIADDGWLITESGPFPSTGYHSLDGVLVKHPGDVAIVDGVVMLSIRPRTNSPT
ncbi:MAG: hypothetical protein R3B13_34750 [Polyangiaceae bacterium]